MEIELAEELSDRSFFFFLGVYLGLTALLTTVFMIMGRTAGALQSLDVFTNHRPCVPWLSTMLLWRWWEIGYMLVFPLLKVLCDVKSSNSCDVEPFREAPPHLSPILTERQRGRTSSSQQITWWGWDSGIGARLYNTYRYPLQMRKALGWYVRKAFSFMASQNIPSQSCTHLLRILLVMVVVLVIKEVAIWCSFQGLLSTSLVVGLLQHAKSGCYQDHPSSSSTSYVGQSQASKLLLLCLCEAPLSALVNTRVGFLGPYWWPKLGLLGQIGFETAFIGSNWCVNWGSNCFGSAYLVSRFVYWVKLVSKVWTEYSKPLEKDPLPPPKKNLTPQKWPPDS